MLPINLSLAANALCTGAKVYGLLPSNHLTRIYFIGTTTAIGSQPIPLTTIKAYYIEA